MKKLSLLIIFLFFCSTFKSQNFVWAKAFTGINLLDDGFGFSVAADDSGNVYSIGYVKGLFDFDPGPGVVYLPGWGGTTDIFVTKMDKNGNYRWAFSIVGQSDEYGQAITVDKAGNVYVTGAFKNSPNFNPGFSSSFYMTSNGDFDIFVAKYDTYGNFIWAKSMGSSNEDWGHGIALDSMANVYISTHFTNSTVDFDPGPGTYTMSSIGYDGALVKLDSSGNFKWAKGINGSNNDQSFLPIVDKNGNVYSTGFFSATVDFNPGIGTYTLTSQGLEDAYIQKLDSSGNFLWAIGVGSSGFDRGTSLTFDSIGNVYLTGYFAPGITDFDPGPATYTMNSSGYQVFLLKLDPNGNFIYVKDIGAVSATGNSSISKNGDIFTGGGFGNVSDFDPGLGTYTMVPMSTSSDGYVSRLDGAGNFISAGKIGGPYSDGAGWITTDKLGNAFLVGRFTEVVDTDPGPGTYTLGAVSRVSLYIIKLSDCKIAPASPGSINGNSIICNGTNQIYTTTPVSGATSYSWTLPGGWTGTSITNTISVVANSSGTIFVSAVNPCGSSSAQSLVITVNNPVVNAVTSNTQICVGQTATLTATGASTYTWNPGGIGTSIIISPTITTTYTLNGMDVNGCMNMTSLTQNVSACTSLNQFEMSDGEINIFPNPFSDKITIISNSPKQTAQIFNILGKLIYSILIKGEKTEIDLTQCPSGVYFIKIDTLTKKIVKQ